jgi:glycosyltransferase involved in cell wall biosynthesis
MRLVFNAVSAKMGGAANYLVTVLAELHRRELPLEVTVWAAPEQAAALRQAAPSIRVLTRSFAGAAPWNRVAFDQLELRRFLIDEKVDTLFSTANLGMLACPCRQVLLVRNALYFSRLYDRTVAREKPLQVRAAERVRGALTLLSVRAADVVMTPSQAMRDELRPTLGGIGKAIEVNPYGVDLARFTELPFEPRGKGPLRLLFTSLYAEHKNLGTLLDAVERLERGGLAVRLITTADPRSEAVRSRVQAADGERVRALEAKGQLTSVGHLSSEQVKSLYGAADVFVYPSIVESFGHPLVEAMAAGLPVLAADVPINRELGADAALYFSPFDSADCAQQIGLLEADSELRSRLCTRARERAQRFSWSDHVDRLLAALGVSP